MPTYQARRSSLHLGAQNTKALMGMDMQMAQLMQRNMEWRAAQQAKREDAPLEAERVAIARRKIALLERQFAASEKDTDARNVALKELSKYDLNTIDQAPAGSLAAIDRNAVTALIKGYTKQVEMEMAADKAKTKLPAADIQVMREIQKQQAAMSQEEGRPIDQSETPLFQLIMAKGGKGLTEGEVKKMIIKQMGENPEVRKMLKDPEAATHTAEMIDTLAKKIVMTRDASVEMDKSKLPGGQQQPSTLQKTLEQFKQRGRNQTE